MIFDELLKFFKLHKMNILIKDKKRPRAYNSKLNNISIKNKWNSSKSLK